MVSLKRLKVTALFCLWIFGGYLVIQKITTFLSPDAYTLTLPGESQIPFIPEMFIVYFSSYLLPLVFLWILRKDKHLWITLEILILSSLMHFLFFLIIPVNYELRPHIPTNLTEGFMGMAALFFKLDGTYNSFPSLHVSSAFLSYFCVKKFRPDLSSRFLFFAVAIAISTVLVKQHYILDVLSGATLAFLINYFLIVKIDLSQPQQTPPLLLS